MAACLIESSLLGMVLGSRKDLDTALAAGVHAGVFEDSEHREVFAAIAEAEKAGDGRYLAVAKRRPDLSLTLARLHAEAPLVQNVEAYIDEVLARARATEVGRELTALSKRLGQRQIFASGAFIDSELEACFNRLLASAQPDRGPVPIAAALAELVPAIEAQMERQKSGEAPGIPTGFAALDALTGGGFGPGTINVVAARTGRGKTTLAVNFLATAAKAGYACCYFTVEMPTPEILRKLISLTSRVSGTRLRIADLGPEHFDRINDATSELGQRQIWFDDTTGASFEALESGVKRLKRRHGLDLIVVDYIQQFHVERQHRSTYERLTEVSHRLKQLANSQKIAIIALAQLNRQAETGEAEPDVWHIKDSGAIEQDADLVVIIRDGPPRLYVGKNRHGKFQKSFPVEANLEINQFVDANLNLETFS